MIEVNLLPVREARRRADLRQQAMQVLLVLIVVGAGIGYAQSRISSQIESAQRRIRQMESDIKQFQPQLDQVAAFRKKKANLEKKIDIIDGLDRARKGPVRVLDQLAIHTPERLWLTNLTTNEGKIELKGESLDNELVAVLLHGLGESKYFDRVDLDSTELGEDRGGLKTVSFKLQAVLVTPKPPKSKKGKGKGRAKGKGKAGDEPVAS
jgi:type IV pilus assembly protein PilN